MNHGHNINKLTDHLFRQDSGRMVSVLTKIFGIENLETAEDVVQQTFLSAIENWTVKGIPDSPSNWLFMVARNKAIDVIRKNKHSVSYDFSDNERVLLTSEYTLASTMENLWKEELIKDDMLRMMFASCQPGISSENQITLILKTLCGFSTAEIARTLLTTQDTISKRLYRTREYFRENKVKLEIPSVAELKERTNAVLNSIYLLFNEGYNSSKSEQLIRKDLMTEALMLCKLLIDNNHTQLPEAFALMALMCFHAARSESRLTQEGDIILLQYQDRTKWDFAMIELGNCYMSKAASGSEISPYHLEAAIAFEHCIAKDFNSTNWERILELYTWLCQFWPSPICELNRIVAVMQVSGAEKALESLQQIPEKEKLKTFYLYHSLLGEISLRLNRFVEAKSYFETARGLTNSEGEKQVLQNKIASFPK
ncbi:MAG TPA: sigma-70 family RNA polymerase sigma factor [Puia sp.]|nr:sigma-70 family RNA polymerase sigma factor [Puia sp.]